MKKHVFGRKLSRGRPAREALFSSLIRSMILNDKITTTRAKAKAVIGDMERVVTLAKKNTLSSRRQVLAMLDNAKDATEKLFKDVSNSFKDRQSGFTRIINLGTRKGDNSEIVRIEWTEAIVAEVKKKDKKGTKKSNENTSTKTKRS